ncbi:MAG: hypothetical protein ACKO96_28430, partial [Flammeovirgaceae bacterium]
MTIPENIDSYPYDKDNIRQLTKEEIDAKLDQLAQHNENAPEIMKLMYIAKLGCDIGGTSKYKTYSKEERMEAAAKVTDLLLDEEHVSNILQRMCDKL